MNALELLKTDHDRLRALFQQLIIERGKQQIYLLLDNIFSDLDVHTDVEETVFYRAVCDIPALAPLADKFYGDHEEVKEIIRHWSDSKIPALISLVEKHIEEEENELFPQLRSVMTPSELLLLGQRMLAYRLERNMAA
jgi:hemerythrin superfamily protein